MLRRQLVLEETVRSVGEKRRGEEKRGREEGKRRREEGEKKKREEEEKKKKKKRRIETEEKRKIETEEKRRIETEAMYENTICAQRKLKRRKEESKQKRCTVFAEKNSIFEYAIQADAFSWNSKEPTLTLEPSMASRVSACIQWRSGTTIHLHSENSSLDSAVIAGTESMFNAIL
ncbi:hypothetical protein BZA77DRAFT_352538 [Pyronema omphalodes]|nr:hypothetical protein BZA77DRAFT_352538 [Pyronema omphalodes]